MQTIMIRCVTGVQTLAGLLPASRVEWVHKQRNGLSLRWQQGGQQPEGISLPEGDARAKRLQGADSACQRRRVPAGAQALAVFPVRIRVAPGARMPARRVRFRTRVPNP